MEARERQGLLCDSQSVLIGQGVDRSRLRNVCWIHVKLVMRLAEFSSPMATFRVNSSHLGAISGQAPRAKVNQNQVMRDGIYSKPQNLVDWTYKDFP